MKQIVLILLAAAVRCLSAADSAPADPANGIIALERKAMDAWQQGNPDVLLSMSDPGITYFHVVSDKRVDGLDALRQLCEPYRGRPLFDSYEMVEPKVQFAGGAAVLSYQLVTHNGDRVRRWNATHVYQSAKTGWRLIHSHFSQTATLNQ